MPRRLLRGGLILRPILASSASVNIFQDRKESVCPFPPPFIPQHMAAPPNMEAPRMFSSFRAVLFSSANRMLLKDESTGLIIFRLLAGSLLLHHV